MNLTIFGRTNRLKSRALALGIVFLFFFLSVFHLAHLKPGSFIGRHGAKVKDTVQIAKASMLYGPQNDIYEAAMMTHNRHNEIFGYEMHVLTRPITDGYWSKFAYLLSLVVQELAKPEDERVEWIM
jgi:hypothetical protein